MFDFYDGLSNGLDPVAALRQAKLGMIRSERKSMGFVHRWAPFVLVGAPGRARAEMAKR